MQPRQQIRVFIALLVALGLLFAHTALVAATAGVTEAVIALLKGLTTVFFAWMFFEWSEPG